LFYGWAERNTRPEVKSNERKRNKLNGLLCVDALSGEEFFRLSPQAKTEDVSEYLAELCLDCVELGYTQLCIILDKYLDWNNYTAAFDRLRDQTIYN